MNKWLETTNGLYSRRKKDPFCETRQPVKKIWGVDKGLCGGNVGGPETKIW